MATKTNNCTCPNCQEIIDQNEGKNVSFLNLLKKLGFGHVLLSICG